ncbi:PilC beta-propeller domain-containing protein [Desulfonema limicola]|uniref:PilC beta-propeller domain-containing protein n=1 Tax=Desulfonema limicola TaxID=45656 RepID=A0A975BDJ5_9BACT|nr:PilC/PilY family type IV pilus protein [Desulfonema limicola]QTA83199.1 PilC beta-propeller domain-containing protein [Desulfonema limicola]
MQQTTGIKKKKRLFLITVLIAFLLSIYCVNMSFAKKSGTDEGSDGGGGLAIVGCATSTTSDNSGGFNLDNFIVDGPIEVNENGKLFLPVGDKAVNPGKIVLPFDQEVWVSFIYEGAGYRSDFGYILLEDAAVKDADGNILYRTKNNTYEKYDKSKEEADPKYYARDDWGNKIEKFVGWQDGSGNPILPYDKRYPVFVNINASGGILNTDNHLSGYKNRPNNDKDLANYDDGTHIPFIPYTGDGGKITRKDMRKSLGTFKGGTELIFFLSADHRYNVKDYSDRLTYFTKMGWNPDTYSNKIPVFPPPTPHDEDDDIVYWKYCKPCEDNSKEICCECSAEADVEPCEPCRTDGKFGYKECSKNKYKWQYSLQPFEKYYHLGTSGGGSWKVDSGWMSETAVGYVKDDYGIVLPEDAVSILTIQREKQYSHVMVGAPPDNPNLWLLGWEDLKGGGDTDHEDLVFLIERKTGGTVTLQSQEDLKLSEEQYYTAVTIEIKDSLPCPGKTGISYFVSIDGGTSWTEVIEWNEIRKLNADGSIGEDITQSWTPGYPTDTYRSGRIDFAGLGVSGRDLVWKAEVVSETANDSGVTCSPEIINVKVIGSVAAHAFFSRASPVVETNVIYSGSYETPAPPGESGWGEDKTLRGHLKATRIYDPAAPTPELAGKDTATAEKLIWDAGEMLSAVPPKDRKIYMPDMTDVTLILNENIGTGTGDKKTFTYRFSHYPVSAGTVSITDGYETFHDIRTDELEGNKGGVGYINRFTGVVRVTFKFPPDKDVSVLADYTYYVAKPGLKEFNTANVDSVMLGLDKSHVNSVGFKFDFNNDGKFNNVGTDGSGTPDDSDGDWLVEWIRGYADGSAKSKPKDWLLGSVDHSVPAVVVPPGMPIWYQGTKISTSMKDSYKKYAASQQTRPTVVYVGARDGMVHAFDGGQYRRAKEGYTKDTIFSELIWGDNPETKDVQERRGYFKWKESGNSESADYGTGNELWSFIPANLIPRFKNNLLKAEDQAYADASPAVADVYVDGKWKTVLLVAEGNGGDTVFCLDVTDPANPYFLWEFADPELFRSISSPAVASIGIMMGADGQAKWAAFFVSGKSYDSSLSPSIYIINIADGSLIKRVYLTSGGEAGNGGTPSGQPSVIDTDGNGYVDRLYIGTDKGFLYKVNIPDETAGEPTECLLNPDSAISGVSGGKRLPIYASPAIISDVDDDGNNIIRVFYGTGDSPYYAETINEEQNYAFFAFIDKDDKKTCSAGTLDWFKEMESGHRIWASAFAAAGNIYFGTSTSDTEDPCDGYEDGDTSSNAGKIFGYKMNSGDSVGLDGQTVGNVISSPLVEDRHLYIKTASSPDPISFGDGRYENEKDDIFLQKLPPSPEHWQEVY